MIPLLISAGLKIARGAAVKDFGCGQGGEGASARSPASPQRAVLAEPTPPTDKRLTATGVFALQAVWLRCSSVADPRRVWASQALLFGFPKRSRALTRIAVSLVTPRQPAFRTKTAQSEFLDRLLRQAVDLLGWNDFAGTGILRDWMRIFFLGPSVNGGISGQIFSRLYAGSPA